MKRLMEILAFVGLALAVHLAFALRFEIDDGVEAGGQGGAAMMTIAAASASVETMVAEWEAPPKTSQIVPPPVAPDADPTEVAPERPDTRPDLAPALAAAISLPSAPENTAERPEIDLSRPPPQAPAPMLQTVSEQVLEPVFEPISESVPDSVVDPAPSPIAVPSPILAPVSEPVFEREPDPIIEPEPSPDPIVTPEEPQRTPLDDQGRPTTSKRPLLRPETEVVPKPTPAPSPKPKRAKPAEAASPASAGSAARTSAGSGGASQAGASGKSTVKTQNKSQHARLQTVWGGKIRARIARQKRVARGTKGKGRVALRLTVAPEGRVLSVQIMRSSGNSVFDQAAVSAVSRAGRMPKAPKGLDKPSYKFNLYVDFDH
jgi:periplasmic protein TonB